MVDRPSTAPTSYSGNIRPASARVPLPTLEQYVFTERLGAGTYATVYKAFKKTGVRETVAIKCILKRKLNKISTENLLTEIELMKLLRHDHIVQLKDFEWDKNYIYIIMEYCSGGDLLSFLRLKRALSEQTVRRFLQQIASALQYMHEKNVAHLDLKPQNILLSSRTNPRLKIADFGFAHHIVGDVDTNYLKGSPLYMAPEIVCEKKYDAKADLWSLGVILYECLFGQAPYASSNLTELAAKIKNAEPIIIPAGFSLSAECNDLLSRLLQRDPTQRISFEDFFSHPFIELERLPSSNSLPTAIGVVKEAIAKDEANQYVEAIELYVKAMDHFIGALHHEKSEKTKDAIRAKLTSYLSRTETLKNLVKTNVELSKECADNSEFVELAKTHPQLPTILSLQAKAHSLEEAEEFEKALAKQERSIQQLLRIAKDLADGRLKTLLREHIQMSLIKAERLADYIKALKATRRHRKTDNFSQVRETCHMQ